MKMALIGANQAINVESISCVVLDPATGCFTIWLTDPEPMKLSRIDTLKLCLHTGLRISQDENTKQYKLGHV